MHALDIIIRRNAEAAGREMAHADNDGDDRKASAILAAASWDEMKAGSPFLKGYADAA